jgi:hypothetical protein
LKAIVHIGTEKTGTTSIQEFLYQNRKKLKAAGFHFIQSAGEQNNRILPAYCIDDDKPDDFFRDLGLLTLEQRIEFKREFIKKFEGEIHSVPGNIHTVIISSEHFHSRIRTEAEMDNVYRLLSTYFNEFKIICYLREQVTTCTSGYSTNMKTGGMESLETYLQRCNPKNYFYNYYDMLGNWERCFGFGALDVSLFAQDRFLNGDLLDDFAAKIDPALLGKLTKPIRAENESLKPIGQALARAINITFPMRTGRTEAHELRDRCKKVIIESFTGKGQQPTPSVRRKIYESFIESNEQVRQKYFPQIETLFAPPTETFEESYSITEDDFQGIAAVFNVLKRHGKGTMLEQEYASVCSTIFSCINDVIEVGSDDDDGSDSAIEMDEDDDDMGDTSMIFDKDDISLLLCAAGSIRGRDPKSAFGLAALADRIAPDSPGIKEKMDEYRKRAEQAPKLQFLVTYQTAEPSVDQSEVKRRLAEFQTWVGALNVPEGSPLTRLTGSCTVRADDALTESGQLSRVGFSMIEAESMDEALSVARKCPLLALGGTLEVSEFAELKIQ